MSFFGVGILEMLAIFLIAFIVMGPEKMIHAVRILGKLVLEVRRLTSTVSMLALDDLNDDGKVAQHCSDTDAAQKCEDGEQTQLQTNEYSGDDSVSSVPTRPESE